MRDYINLIEKYLTEARIIGVDAGDSIREILRLHLFQDFGMDPDNANEDPDFQREFQGPVTDLMRQIFAMPAGVTITQDVADIINRVWPNEYAEEEIYFNGAEYWNEKLLKMYTRQLKAATAAVKKASKAAGIKSIDDERAADQMRKHIVKSLLKDIKNGRSSYYTKNAIAYYRNQGLDYPEFEKLLGVAEKNQPYS